MSEWNRTCGWVSLNNTGLSLVGTGNAASGFDAVTESHVDDTRRDWMFYRTLPRLDQCPRAALALGCRAVPVQG